MRRPEGQRGPGKDTRGGVTAQWLRRASVLRRASPGPGVSDGQNKVSSYAAGFPPLFINSDRGPVFLGVCVNTMCFYKRPALVPAFAHPRESEEDFRFYDKRRKAESAVGEDSVPRELGVCTSGLQLRFMQPLVRCVRRFPKNPRGDFFGSGNTQTKPNQTTPHHTTSRKTRILA